MRLIARKKNGDTFGSELKGIAVAAGNESFATSLLFSGGSGAQKIIRLEAGRLRVLKAACPNKLGQNIEPFEQSIVELSPTLISQKRFMPIGGNLKRVPRNQHRARFFFAV
jgi:hypothetical protein